MRANGCPSYHPWKCAERFRARRLRLKISIWKATARHVKLVQFPAFRLSSSTSQLPTGAGLRPLHSTPGTEGKGGSSFQPSFGGLYLYIQHRYLSMQSYRQGETLLLSSELTCCGLPMVASCQDPCFMFESLRPTEPPVSSVTFQAGQNHCTTGGCRDGCWSARVPV